MDMNKINRVLRQIGKNKNYTDFINLLSFEERKYIFYNILEFAENFSVFDDDSMLKYFFNSDEADILYKDFDNMSEVMKVILSLNLNEEIKISTFLTIKDDFYKVMIFDFLEKDSSKIYLLDFIKDEKEKLHLLSKINDFEYKMDYIKKIDLSVIDTYYFKEVVESINDDKQLEEIIRYLNEKYFNLDKLKYIVIQKFTNDELKIKYIDTITNKGIKIDSVKFIIDDYKKIELLKKYLLKYEVSSDEGDLIDSIIRNILTSLKEDKFKLENLYLLDNNYWEISYVLKSLKSDQLKLDNMHLAGTYAADVFSSIEEDNLKIDNIETIVMNPNTMPYECMNIFNNIKNVEERFRLISKYIDKISIYSLLHCDYLDDIKTIYPNIINKLSEYYYVDENNLTIMIEKYGYNIIKFLENKNIQAMINCDIDYFNKILKIIDLQKSQPLTMRDVDNIVGALLQREFRFSNKDIVMIFPTLENFINNKNIVGIKDKLNEINMTVNINEILLKYNIDYNAFIDGLINKDIRFINILHEMTDLYIDSKRTEYLLENKEKIKEELNLEKSYEKNYLLDKMFMYSSVDEIYLLISTLDKSNFNDEQVELLNNEELLKECILFRKNPKEYNGDPSIKGKIKLLNQILSQLYLSKQIDYFGDNDLDAKVIYNVKKVNTEELFKIIQEIDIEKFKIKTLSNEEIYNKLLKIMSSYHFLGWSDIFESLLVKADLSFGDDEIGVFITYFYNFYPKLEEKLKNGEIKSISLTTLIDECSVYGSSSVKYKYLISSEDYGLIVKNPPNNAAPMEKLERLKRLPNSVKIQYKRKYITVPPVQETFSLSTGNKINVEIGNVTDSMNLTYGERTGACMRIGGAGGTLFNFCLENENGFHVSFTDSKTGKFISRVSGFRNGNTVFFNQLRFSLDENITSEDLIEATSKLANLLVEKTKNSEFPIKNVVISNGFAMGSSTQPRESLNISDVKEGFEHFYSDVSASNAIYLEKNDEIKLGPNNVERYDVSRRKVQVYDDENEIRNNIQKFKLINGLLIDEQFEDIGLVNNEAIEKISRLIVGEDWLVALDQNGNVIDKFILNRDEYFMRKARVEMQKVDEYLTQHVSLDNEIGGKTI